MKILVEDVQKVERWKEGNGVSIVDARRGQLSATGWMHNRVRMITLISVKNLLIDWKKGKYFRRYSLMAILLKMGIGNG